MQAYDLIMLLVLVAATIFGAIKGFAWQVASLASIFVSYFVAYNYRYQVAELIDARPPWNLFLAMLLLYAGSTFAIWVVFRLVSGQIDRVKLKEFDRHLGAGFGFIKGALFCLLITMFAVTLTDERKQQAICQSRSGYYISKFLANADGLLPAEIEQVIGPRLEALEQKLNQHQNSGGPGFGFENSNLVSSPTTDGNNATSFGNATFRNNGGANNAFGSGNNFGADQFQPTNQQSGSLAQGITQGLQNQFQQGVSDAINNQINSFRDSLQNSNPVQGSRTQNFGSGFLNNAPNQSNDGFNPAQLLRNGGRLPSAQQLQRMLLPESSNQNVSSSGQGFNQQLFGQQNSSTPGNPNPTTNTPPARANTAPFPTTRFTGIAPPPRAPSPQQPMSNGGQFQ